MIWQGSVLAYSETGKTQEIVSFLFRTLELKSDNGFVLAEKQWMGKTHAIGIISKVGRYGGNTLAHKEITFEFGLWISLQ